MTGTGIDSYVVQVPIPFCLEFKVQTEALQEESETKLMLRGVGGGLSFVGYQGRRERGGQRRRGTRVGGARGGA